MGEITLFTFDFSEEHEKMFSDENVKKKFELVQEKCKENGNSYFISLKSLPENTVMYVDHFVKRGWIERRGNGINILDEHLKYHTLDELVRVFEEDMNKVCGKENVCWYQDVIPVINFSASPIRIQDNIKKELYEAKKEISKNYALYFGLKHFKEVPSSRGHRMGSFSKWAKKNILPIIITDVLNLANYEEVKEYFNKNIFFFGRRDWDKGYKITPYPEFRKLSPHYLDIASLSQAETEKDVELILDYCGQAFLDLSSIEENENIIYPEGWSFDKYIDSLTDEDRQLLWKDRKRLENMHGRDILGEHLVFDYI